MNKEVLKLIIDNLNMYKIVISATEKNYNYGKNQDRMLDVSNHLRDAIRLLENVDL